jgi:phospholipid/cholesterol/gamma-HCH transport system substrate-binding protein
METRASYTLIGASLVAGVIAFVGFILWLGHVQFNRAYAEYNVAFEGAVNGLSEGGQVRYLGINVGEVTDLYLDSENPNQVMARIRIDAETPVRNDSSAILDFAGLTGVTFIQIQPGSDGADLMPKRTGNDLPTIKSERTQLAEIFEGGQDLIATAQITLAELNAVLDKENAETLRSILKNVETISSAIAEDEQLLSEATRAMAALAEAGMSIDDAANAISEFGSTATSYVDELNEGTKTLFQDASGAVKRAEGAIDRSEKAFLETRTALKEPTELTIEEIRLMAQDMRMLIGRFDRIARELEQNPQALIQGSPRPYKD